MQLRRTQLSVLFNALYDTDASPITVRHPAAEVGDLLTIELGDPTNSIVRFEKSPHEYRECRSAIDADYGPPAVTELPKPRSFTSAMLAGGLIEPANKADIDEFLEQNGHPDLSAGHRPVVAGFDTNLLPWRIADVLGLTAGQDAVINGYALATGVRDELDWNEKRSDTRAIEAAFGEEFAALWNQPKGWRREGRLGENYYRQLRDHRYGDQFDSDIGDEAIIAGYDEYQSETAKDVLLFSNDRDFVERAVSHRIRAQRVEFPDDLPRTVNASWAAIQDTLYVLSVLFGVLVLPKVTLYGVWKGKEGLAWEREALEVDCRSPKVRERIERDLAIIWTIC